MATRFVAQFMHRIGLLFQHAEQEDSDMKLKT
jgi:hypothetical protein